MTGDLLVIDSRCRSPARRLVCAWKSVPIWGSTYSQTRKEQIPWSEFMHVSGGPTPQASGAMWGLSYSALSSRLECKYMLLQVVTVPSRLSPIDFAVFTMFLDTSVSQFRPQTPKRLTLSGFTVLHRRCHEVSDPPRSCH